MYGILGEEGGENGLVKGSFVWEGFFEDVDVVLCVYLVFCYGKMIEFLVNDLVDIKFYGVVFYVVVVFEKGVNVLEVLI